MLADPRKNRTSCADSNVHFTERRGLDLAH
jgi:hypothetical protein